MALAYAGVEVELREVVLRDKPAEMLAISAKGTVPVLQLSDQVLNESLDVMLWALQQNDPQDWLGPQEESAVRMKSLVARCDGEFKHWLDRYKYADRYPEASMLNYRREAERFLSALEQQLAQAGPWLNGAAICYADVAIFPFVRQFAFVDKPGFEALPYPRVQAWLETLLNGDLFQSVMQKHPQWRSDA